MIFYGLMSGLTLRLTRPLPWQRAASMNTMKALERADSATAKCSSTRPIAASTCSRTVQIFWQDDDIQFICEVVGVKLAVCLG